MKTILFLSIFVFLAGCSSAEDSECEKLLEVAPEYYKYDYVWGGDDPKKDGGVDCSGYIHSLSKRIGSPLPRTTSKKYYLTIDTKEKHWSEASCTNLIWWTFQPNRPYGHIGMHLKDDKITQSGSSTGPTENKIKDNGFWDKNFETSKDIE